MLMGFLGGSVGKETACSAGDAGDMSLIPGSGRSLEKGMATHFRILAWRIPWTEEPGRLQSIGHKELDMTKQCSNYRTIALISHASKVMLKILQTRLQQYVNCELPDVQADFRKGKGTRDQIANIRLIMEKATEFQKNIYFSFIEYAKAFECGSQ